MIKGLEITSSPNALDLEFVGSKLSDFNDADVGAADKKPIAVFVRDDSDAIIAAISGYTAWGWLYIQWLWVDKAHRGLKLAGKMLDASEQEAIKRSCHGALIDTFSPVAAKAYERQGYKVFGTLANFPIGRSRIYLQKKL